MSATKDREKVVLELGKPIRFLALEWREEWEFDHPSVLLEPFIRYTPNGVDCESLIEESADDVACDGTEVAKGIHPADAKEFAWRRWTLKKLKAVAAAALIDPKSAKFGTGYVCAVEQWVVFRDGEDGLEYDYVDRPTDPETDQ